MKRLVALWLVACLFSLCGCGPRRPKTVAELARSMRDEGVTYRVSETAALSGIPAEGLRLTGPGLAVEVYCIGDDEHLKLAASAAGLAADQTQRAGARPLKYYVEKPFLIIVRQEPAEGQVETALSTIFAH